MRQSPIARYKEVQALHDRLRNIITRLRINKSSQVQQVYSRFYDCLKPPMQEDLSYLPYHIQKRFKLGNLFYKDFMIRKSLNYTFYLWWKYLREEIGPKRIEHCCNYFENILKKGIDNCEVVGNIRTGWRLKSVA